MYKGIFKKFIDLSGITSCKGSSAIFRSQINFNILSVFFLSYRFAFYLFHCVNSFYASCRLIIVKIVGV